MASDIKDTQDCSNSLNKLEQQLLIARNKKDSEPILVDLTQAGFSVEWVSDLYNQRLNYKRAIPILLKWLPLVENPDVKEAIVRALTVRWAKHVAARPLVEEYRKLQKQTNTGIKWAVANALAVVADDDVLSDIQSFVFDLQNGIARKMLVLAIGNMKNPKAIDILVSLLDDEEVAGYAIMALGKLKSKIAITKIEPFQNHPTAWIRREAIKTIRNIEKSS